MRRLFTLGIGLKVGIAVFSLLAAVFWLRAAGVNVPEIDQTKLGLSVNPAEQYNTAMHAASWWNSWAAFCSFVAAILLAIDSFWNAKHQVCGHAQKDFKAMRPIKVTFDTNTFDKVVRPTVYPKNPDFQNMILIHDALKNGQIQGFISSTVVTLEGIRKDDRASVFGSTHLSGSMKQTDEQTFTLALKVEQPDRQPIHPKQVERFLAAFELGIRLLNAPRIGMPKADKKFYASEDPATLAKRIDRFQALLEKIERKGLGEAYARDIATRLDNSSAHTGPWFNRLGKAKGIQETRAVARAIAEWADADSIAAHYGYGNDFFCTLDFATPATNNREPAILDATNRAWLTNDFAVQFVTLAQLAALVRTQRS